MRGNESGVEGIEVWSHEQVKKGKKNEKRQEEFRVIRFASSIMQARARVTGRRYGLGRGGQEGGGGVS